MQFCKDSNSAMAKLPVVMCKIFTLLESRGDIIALEGFHHRPLNTVEAFCQNSYRRTIIFEIFQKFKMFAFKVCILTCIISKAILQRVLFTTFSGR